MQVSLTEEFTLHGKLYGPGVIEVEDEQVAQHLLDAEHRLFGKKRGDKAPPRLVPNAVMQQSVPRDQMPPATPSNGTTMADIQKQAEDANAAAAEQQRQEEAAKAEATNAEAQATAERQRREAAAAAKGKK